MNNQTSYEDIFFSIILIFVGLFTTAKNLAESDWLGMFGTFLLVVLGCLWLSARVYQLTRKDEDQEESKE